MKYKKLRGIVLKKQNFRETDQIVTLWTQETGKIRVLARSLKKPASKLVYNLQDLSYVSVETAGRKNLPVLIGCSTLKSFKDLRNDLNKIGAGFYASELMLKLTADEQPNPAAFNLFVEFLSNLNSQQLISSQIQAILAKFSLNLVEILGFKAKTTRELDFYKANELVESLVERNIKSAAFLIKL
ncbi:MAG: DNA repair protein RecO [Candidatus Doudnabacteria bacterium]|nr:DNA repair protein RecO [Candidatus Doudnabacteria bacterium]